MDFSEIRGVILDMDGVLWRGDYPLVDLPGFFARLKSLGLKIVLATNNSTRSVPQYLEKLRGFGVMLGPENIVTSSMAASSYLSQKYPSGAPVYVIGEVGLKDTLREWGFHYSEAEDVVAVVAGLDRNLNYNILTKGVQLIYHGVEFIGTNPDRTFPSPSGLTPGTGALLAFIQAATGKNPVVMGKPEPYLFQLSLQRMELSSSQVLVVGDRLDTDVLGAQRIGCKSVLVLTGVTTPQDIHPPHSVQSILPDFILNNVDELPNLISNPHKV
ncbi:predicted sugar phosphatases of the HAD superfamily [Anaerolinea thermolimosa]|uniref:HAD-IIA family hydrolase n=1 Tax=Anaerolinea thermolimosa TaxID=229919 RepID=UPI000A03FB9D|nr:HAD-IIA family hydrolase [Anaerolinea thermolimosa]GAP06730.1 predicted sugar phosphatases of the HAD superfamily [Anaerolinea thermolimosa]